MRKAVLKNSNSIQILELLPGYVGPIVGSLVERFDEKNQTDIRLTPSYQFTSAGYPHWNLTFILNYYFSSVSRSIERREGAGFSATSAYDLSEAATSNILSKIIGQNHSSVDSNHKA